VVTPDFGRPVETPETGDHQGRLQRLWETSGDSRDWGPPGETLETGRDSKDWGRPVETPETGGGQWRLQRLGRTVETPETVESSGDSRD
jgi:hypothetical protein